MHRIFSGDGWLEVLGIRVASGKAFAFEPGFAEMDEPSHRHASRVTGVSQRAPVGSQRSRPPDTPRCTIGTAPPGSAGVSPACCPLGCRSVSLRCGSPPLLPVEIAWARPKQSHGAVAGRSGSRRWVRLCQDLCGRDARAPGWSSSPDAVTPTSQYCRSIRGSLVIEGAPSLFVPIRVHSWFVFISKTKTAGCFSSDRPAGRGRGYPILPFSIRTLGLAS